MGKSGLQKPFFDRNRLLGAMGWLSI